MTGSVATQQKNLENQSGWKWTIFDFFFPARFVFSLIKFPNLFYLCTGICQGEEMLLKRRNEHVGKDRRALSDSAAPHWREVFLQIFQTHFDVFLCNLPWQRGWPSNPKNSVILCRTVPWKHGTTPVGTTPWPKILQTDRNMGKLLMEDSSALGANSHWPQSLST